MSVKKTSREKKEGKEYIRLAVDAIVQNSEGKVLMIKRNKDPYKDYWCLVGGHVEYGERLRDAVIREVKEETGLDVQPVGDHIGIFDDPKRDPRYHMISICYLAKVVGGELKADKREVKEMQFYSSNEIRRMKEKIGFDHYEMLEKAGIV